MADALTETESETAAPHPEEMKSVVELRIGNRVVLHVTGRATPAGLIGVGVAVSSVILSIAALIWAARRPTLVRPR
jgi:hypothetical protein